MTTSRLLRAWALTDSRPSADVTLILLRVADLAAALLGEKRVLARWGGRVRTKVFLNTLGVFLLEPVTSRYLLLQGLEIVFNSLLASVHASVRGSH